MLRQRACAIARQRLSPGISLGRSWNSTTCNGFRPSARLNTSCFATTGSINTKLSRQSARSLHSSSSSNPRRNQTCGSSILRDDSLRKLRTPHLLQFIRNVSGKPLPQRRSWFLNFLYRTSAWLGASIGTVAAGVVILFLYDASTYREDLSYKDIHVSDLALSPSRGGMLISNQGGNSS